MNETEMDRLRSWGSFPVAWFIITTTGPYGDVYLTHGGKIKRWIQL